MAQVPRYLLLNGCKDLGQVGIRAAKPHQKLGMGVKDRHTIQAGPDLERDPCLAIPRFHNRMVPGE